MHEAVGGTHRLDSGHPDGVRDEPADNGREASSRPPAAGWENRGGPIAANDTDGARGGECQ
jgi:hypothetical protein